jgi:exopolysaccharide biosynthesis polyprenyl glycosylphosphotransferase
MLRSNEKLILVAQGAMDAILSAIFWLIVYRVRFEYVTGAQEGLGELFFKASLLIAFLTLYFFRREGLYKSYRLSSRQDELLRTLRGNLMAVVSFVVLAYFVAPERLSRGVILGYLGVSSVGFMFYRLLVRALLAHFRRRGYNLRHVFLVGHGLAMQEYVKNIQRFPGSGMQLCAWADSFGEAKRFGVAEFNGDLSQYIRDVQPDSIVINYEGEKTHHLHKRLKELHNDVVPIVILPDLSYSFVGFHIEKMAGVPAFILNQPNFSTANVVVKRLFDLLAAGLGLILISPFLLAISIGVRCSSPGPIFFGQERVGLDGRRFKMWKFRSMRIGTHATGDGTPGWTTKDDPRRTRFGSFIRSTSVDELPQLWNVFVGDMSLVGPRPEQPYYVEKFREEIPAYMLRHKMRAGITGWAQVNGWRGDTSLHKRIECDLYYIRNWSIWLDIKIIVLTFWKGIVDKNAY